jgi:hypothetical protein
MPAWPSPLSSARFTLIAGAWAPASLHTLPYTDLWGHPVIFIPQLSACSKPNPRRAQLPRATDSVETGHRADRPQLGEGSYKPRYQAPLFSSTKPAATIVKIQKPVRREIGRRPNSPCRRHRCRVASSRSSAGLVGRFSRPGLVELCTGIGEFLTGVVLLRGKIGVPWTAHVRHLLR